MDAFVLNVIEGKVKINISNKDVVYLYRCLSVVNRMELAGYDMTQNNIEEYIPEHYISNMHLNGSFRHGMFRDLIRKYEFGCLDGSGRFEIEVTNKELNYLYKCLKIGSVIDREIKESTGHDVSIADNARLRGYFKNVKRDACRESKQ